MGYILPITNYQKLHYHERISVIERDFIPVDRIYPKEVKVRYFTSAHGKMARFTHQFKPLKQTTNNQTQQTSSSDQHDDRYAEITGIGRQINYSI